MKKLFVLIATILTLTMVLIGCQNGNGASKNSTDTTDDDGKLTIVATLFPQYDFTRTIAGDKANVTMLLPPGGDSHSFEPKPSDILTINKSDLFIYTGEYMELWAQGIINSIPEENNVTILDVSKGIVLTKSSDEVSHNHADHDHEEEEHHHDGDDEHNHGGHNHEYDPHIWTNPVYAQIMVENISNSLIQIDPDNAEYYQKNTEELLQELTALDGRIRDIVANGKRKEMYFGGRFAVYYFTNEYGLTPITAYSSVSSESEPSVADVANIINSMTSNSVPVIYYEELTDPRIARTIAEETGAEPLLFHGLHNVSKEDFQGGITYLDIMNQNAENLEKGLQ